MDFNVKSLALQMHVLFLSTAHHMRFFHQNSQASRLQEFVFLNGQKEKLTQSVKYA